MNKQISGEAEGQEDDEDEQEQEKQSAQRFELKPVAQQGE